MSQLKAEQPIPRMAIAAMAGLLAMAVIFAATARLTGVGTFHAPVVAAAKSVDLVFADRADGAVEVTGGGRTTVLEPGTNGFIRGVMRGLARDRRARGIGAEVPFHLVRRVDGRLSLEDPATGRVLDLGAFGPTNADAFSRLLPTD
jgi:putative photosynthetic complex assembly protein